MGKLTDLHGIEYKPVINNGVLWCPKCEKTVLFPLNIGGDPDFFFYRCYICAMDFKKENKPDKDFKYVKRK